MSKKIYIFSQKNSNLSNFFMVFLPQAHFHSNFWKIYARDNRVIQCEKLIINIEKNKRSSAFEVTIPSVFMDFYIFFKNPLIFLSMWFIIIKKCPIWHIFEVKNAR